ncbi:ABC transporter substrate-binding protein [Myxococcota bacterium]|nr:ABC transporter substrate-binding protein [Myxococcota bacterium]
MNLLALVVALVSAAVFAIIQARGDGHPGAKALTEAGDDGTDAPATVVIDARGVAVPIRAWERIASLHLVADHLLLDLVEPERFVATTATSRTQHPEHWRFGERVAVGGREQVEALIEVHPDLVIASNFMDESLLARIEDHGIQVFDLGEMRGVATTIEDIRTLGILLRAEDRARRLEDRFLREIAALHAAVPRDDQPEGLYLSVYGDAWFGGTAGSSYSDLLALAGIHDLAADHGFKEWPPYTPEQLLGMDPALIVTQEGMAAAICDHTLLRRLRACTPAGRVVELPGRYHTDPGLGLVPAVQDLQDLVHPGARARLDPTVLPSFAPPTESP